MSLTDKYADKIHGISTFRVARDVQHEDETASVQKAPPKKSIYSPQKEKERPYRGFNFFDSRDLSIPEAVSRGEYMPLVCRGAAHLTVKNLILVPALAS